MAVGIFAELRGNVKGKELKDRKILVWGSGEGQSKTPAKACPPGFGVIRLL
jgi:hypothetical protein